MKNPGGGESIIEIRKTKINRRPYAAAGGGAIA